MAIGRAIAETSFWGGVPESVARGAYGWPASQFVNAVVEQRANSMPQTFHLGMVYAAHF
jgi:hypothetical protein